MTAPVAAAATADDDRSVRSGDVIGRDDLVSGFPVVVRTGVWSQLTRVMRSCGPGGTGELFPK